MGVKTNYASQLLVNLWFCCIVLVLCLRLDYSRNDVLSNVFP